LVCVGIADQFIYFDKAINALFGFEAGRRRPPVAVVPDAPRRGDA
jgi:hypothetical protein